MHKHEMQFRGQEVIVIKGDVALPSHMLRGKVCYDIRSHQTEDMPLSIEGLVVFNKWGTIIASEPIEMDIKNDDQMKFDCTHLSMQETMGFMGYQ